MNPLRSQVVVDILDYDGSRLPASKEVVIMKSNDRLEALLGDGKAKIEVGIVETMGGPYGYSSVKIQATVSLTCDQSVGKLREAQACALDECLLLIDEHIQTAHAALCEHLALLNPSE